MKCSHCKAAPVEGHTMCAKHLEAMRVASRRWRERHRAEYLEYHREYERDRKQRKRAERSLQKVVAAMVNESGSVVSWGRVPLRGHSYERVSPEHLTTAVVLGATALGKHCSHTKLIFASHRIECAECHLEWKGTGKVVTADV